MRSPGGRRSGDRGRSDDILPDSHDYGRSRGDLWIDTDDGNKLHQGDGTPVACRCRTRR